MKSFSEVILGIAAGFGVIFHSATIVFLLLFLFVQVKEEREAIWIIFLIVVIITLLLYARWIGAAFLACLEQRS